MSASVKQHLAALRMLFDWFVVGQVLPFNPAGSVRGPKQVVKKGKTPVLSAEEARGLLDGIDLSTLAGLRDRALIGVLVFSFRAGERGGVDAGLRTTTRRGRRSFFRLHEKGGRYNVVPAHHLAQEYVDAYLEAAELGEDRKGPLFPELPGRAAGSAAGACDDAGDGAPDDQAPGAAGGAARRRSARTVFGGPGSRSISGMAAISRWRQGSRATSRRARRSSTTGSRTRSRLMRSSGFISK